MVTPCSSRKMSTLGTWTIVAIRIDQLAAAMNDIVEIGVKEETFEKAHLLALAR